MIIFGTRQRFKTIDTGEFYCPQCRARRSYVHKQARPYFALYFVPVFPVGQGHDLIECGTCGTQFTMDVLQATPPQPRPDLASLINGVGRDLAAGQPVEFVIRSLTSHGLDLDAARHVVEGQLGATVRACATCGLTYAPGVTTCSECGQSLAAPSTRRRG